MTRKYRSGALCVAVLLASCASSSQIYLVKRIDLAVLSQSGGVSRPMTFSYKTPRYVVRMGSGSANGEINDRAAELIEEGKFPQAAALLESIISDDSADAAPFNNLGIIREVFGDDAGAFSYYTRACALRPDDQELTWNFRNVGNGKK
ncbi:MAG TPA: hypothetical protein VF857_03725 [Spirochaetota bacterium]